MHYVFILNPLAGPGGIEEKLAEQIKQLPEAKDCELYITKEEKDATRYVRDYCQKHPDEEIRFIACGGDGTISEVFNGAMGQPNVSVTCYPCGSGNDFVKSFGGSEKFLDLHKLIQAKTQDLDMLKVNDEYSNNVVNFGFDATVAIKVQEDRKKYGHGSKSSYTKGILVALVKSMRNKFKVYADGKLLNPSGEAMMCTLGNGQYVGGSFRCAPRAITNDGLMEVCLIRTVSRLRFPFVLPSYVKGTHLDNEKYKDIFTYCRARKVEVEAPEGFALSRDGEIVYGTHFIIEVIPAALKLAVPE